MAGNNSSGRKSDQQIDDLKKTFAYWGTLSRDQRMAAGEPTTQKAFADHYGMSEQTLCRWKQDPDFKQYVAKVTLQRVSMEDVAGIINKLVADAKKGSVPAAREILNRCGIQLDNPFFGDKETESDVGDLAGLSDEELEALDAA